MWLLTTQKTFVISLSDNMRLSTKPYYFGSHGMCCLYLPFFNLNFFQRFLFITKTKVQYDRYRYRTSHMLQLCVYLSINRKCLSEEYIQRRVKFVSVDLCFDQPNIPRWRIRTMRTFSLLLHVENDTWTCYGLIWTQAPASMLFKVYVQALVLDSVQNLGSLRYTLIVVKEGLGMVYLLLGRRIRV